MRKHKHLARFTTASVHERELLEAQEAKKPFYLLRRAHHLTPRQPPAPSVLAKAHSRRFLYMHAAARRRAEAEVKTAD